MGNKAIGYCLENEKVEDIPENLKELLPEIFQTIKTDLHAIKQALATLEYENLYNTCHALTGVCGMFGFKRLSTLISDLSKNVKAQNYILAEELISALEMYLAQLQQPHHNRIISDSDTYAQDAVPLLSSRHRDD